jgi:polar amino acid transport system substrate-binding protein
LAIAVPRDAVGRGWAGFFEGIDIDRTFGVVVVLMFASIGLIAGFTATISASLTAEKLTGRVRGLQDLPHVRVGSVTQSEFRWLTDNGIVPAPFSTSQDGLQAIVDDRIDAFVFDEISLKHIAKTDFPGRIHVLSETFDHYFLCVGLPLDCPLRKPINKALLRMMETDQWRRLVMRYIGSGD